MTTRYVDGTNGNDAWDGLTPVFVAGSVGPKKTLTGAEATAAAGDLVHVRAGVYRELLTCAVSGAAGSPIEYRGDYAGLIWPGGGVVRITGSNNDLSATRTLCVNLSNRNYRVFTNLHFDGASTALLSGTNSVSTNITISKCAFYPQISQNSISCDNSGNSFWKISECYFEMTAAATGVIYSASINANDSNNTIENCVFLGGQQGINNVRFGGVTIKNCMFKFQTIAVRILTALAAGQTMTVNNCTITQCGTGFSATIAGELVENYNCVYGNGIARTNVTAGANSVTTPPLFDSRWFFQLTNAAAGEQVISPYDLSQWSQLIGVAGTNPTTTDLRGQAAIGGVRELGALEYNPALKINGAGISRARAQ